MTNLRTIKRKDGTGWTTVQLSELGMGDIFTMFESPDEQIGGEWIAMGNPSTDQSGTWGITANAHTD